jgi:release factor glutamine methyltransferase
MSLEKIWTVLDILRWTSDYFKSNDVDSPRLSAELLLCEVLGCTRVQLYLKHEFVLRKDELEKYRSMILRRAKDREPLQYILGHTEFYALRFEVNPSVLIPRPETELVIDTVRELASAGVFPNGSPLRILDIGTGSGCIGITLAKIFPNAQVVAIDKSPTALMTAKRNAEYHQLPNISFVECDVLELSSAERLGGVLDCIVSNPPYIGKGDMAELDREVSAFEPEIALTDQSDGLSFYRKFNELIPELLKPQGWMICEFGFGQANQIEKLFSDYKPTIKNDLAKIPRVVYLQRFD